MDNKKTPVATTGVPNTEQSSTDFSIAQMEAFERAYIERFGLALFPIKERDKVPMTPNGFKNATSILDAYHKLHGGQSHNVAMPTGPLNGLFVLDIDPRHGGNETFAQLITDHGPLPPTWQAKTQSGGTHYFFRWDEQRPVMNRVDVLPGLDFRGEGGYVLLPPSRVEGVYEWVRSPSKFQLLPAPDWVYKLIDTPGKTGQKDLSYLADGVQDGRRNVSMTELCGMLLGRSVPVKIAWTLTEAYNRCYVDPPIEEKELLRTFESIANREIAKRRRRLGRFGA